MLTKRSIIGALVGAVIIFIWQFLSWALINIHSVNQQYTADQDEIIEFLQNKFTTKGTWFMPNVPPGTSSEETQKFMETNMGRPTISISYNPKPNNNMAINMIRGFSANILALFLLLWIFGRFELLKTSEIITTCIFVGIIGYLTTDYSNSAWFGNNTIPDLIDAFVAWLLCGTWLSFWLRR